MKRGTKRALVWGGLLLVGGAIVWFLWSILGRALGIAKPKTLAAQLPPEFVKRLLAGEAKAQEYIDLGPKVGPIVAAESWLNWHQVPHVTIVPYNAEVQANDALSHFFPGWNSKPAGATPIDGEGPKKAFVFNLFKSIGGRPGIFKDIPGVT